MLVGGQEEVMVGGRPPARLPMDGGSTPLSRPPERHLMPPLPFMFGLDCQCLVRSASMLSRRWVITSRRLLRSRALGAWPARLLQRWLTSLHAEHLG